MNRIWSTQIQGIHTLYESRALRFNDGLREDYVKAFCIPANASVLEIGCGPGALCESLARWYPHASVTGLDRDRNFVDFATERSPHIGYLEGDATALPFADGSLDVTISNTVQEHIPPEGFYGEQYRVLKDGGICLVLSSRRGYHIPAPCISELTDLERRVYEAIEPYDRALNRAVGMGAYATDERGIPTALERYGFKQVSTAYITVNLTPDNPIYDRKTAHAIINSERLGELDCLDSIPAIAPGLISEADLDELRRIKNAKYDERLLLYDRGVHQWDCVVSVIQITRAVK